MNGCSVYRIFNWLPADIDPREYSKSERVIYVVCTLKTTGADFLAQSETRLSNTETRWVTIRMQSLARLFERKNPLNLWHHRAEISVMNLSFFPFFDKAPKGWINYHLCVISLGLFIAYCSRSHKFYDIKCNDGSAMMMTRHQDMFPLFSPHPLINQTHTKKFPFNENCFNEKNAW